MRTAPSGALVGKTSVHLLQSLTPKALSQITLAQLLRSNNFLAAVTVLQLLDSLDKSKLTLVDLVTLLLEPSAFDWESFDLGSLKPQTLDGVKGGVVDYAADVTLMPIAGPVGVKAPATVAPGLPADFAYIGAAQRLVELLAGNPVPGSDVALKDPVAGDPIAWKAKLKVGTTYRITIPGRAGHNLGQKSTTFTATPTSANSVAATSAASVVVVGDTFEPNDTFTTTVAVPERSSADAFYLSFIRNPGDVDYFTYTVPASAPEGPESRFGSATCRRTTTWSSTARKSVHSTSPNTPPLDGQAVGTRLPPLTHLNETLATQALNDVALKDGLPAGEAVMASRATEGRNGRSDRHLPRRPGDVHDPGERVQRHVE